MGILIEWAIYAAIAAAIAFGVHKAWDGFKESIAEPYVAKQIEADQVVVARANAERDAAKRQAADSLTDIKACKDKADEQSSAVDRLEKAGKDKDAEIQKMKRDLLVANAGKTAAIAEQQRLAHAPPVKDQTCQQQLDAATKVMRDNARSRLQGAAK